MVEKLLITSEANNAVSLDSHSIKAMSKTGASKRDQATNGDEPDSESGTTQGETDDDNNCSRDASGGSLEQVSTSAPADKNGNNTSSKDCAKKDSERLIETGTSSDNSIKTTPDSSLEPPSTNCESSLEIRPDSNKKESPNNLQSTDHSEKEVVKSPNSKNDRNRQSSNSLSPPKRKQFGPIKDNSLDRGPLNIRALPFESGINTECISLLRQLWNLHDEALHFLNNVHQTLNSYRRWLALEDNEFESSTWEKKRLSSSSSSSALKANQSRAPLSMENGAVSNTGVGEDGKDARWIPLQPFIDGLKCISDNVSEIERQCLTLSVFHSQCKLVLFAKIRHAKRQVTHDRLAILHSINQLVTVATQLLASPSFWGTPETDVVAAYACTLFHLSETYNACLESCWTQIEASLAAANPSIASTPSDADSGKEMGMSVSPSKIRILVQVKAANTNDAPLVKQSLKPLTATKLLQLIAQRRAPFTAFEFTKHCFKSFYDSESSALKIEKFVHFVEDESLRLSTFEKAFSQRPSILGRVAVKETENGEFRLTKKFKLKMYGYFHEVLWSLVGDYSEDLILWSLQSTIPLALHPSEKQIAIRQSILLGVLGHVGKPTPLLQAFETICGALHSFSLMINWDERMRDAFEITYKVKRPEHVNLVTTPQQLEMATDVGRKFKEILSSCMALMESGNAVNSRMSLPPAERQQLIQMFGEEEPLGDEAQILFRLEASLNYFRSWTVRRAKVWLNAWAVSQFIAASQRDPAILAQLIKAKETFLITRDALLKSENVAIRISARNRQMCADDMKTAIQNLQKLPDELLLAVGIVCRTLSLATLQSYMPSPNHWKGAGKGSGLDPDRPSPYVRIFIDHVVAPVFKAAVILVPGLVQEALGKQVINAMCNAWLHYILQKKIKFSEWGAVQLLRDFVALREWIRSETVLHKDARKAILQLEILKSCEGVAYLLLRNPGDVLGVGKSGRKSRRVAPSANDSVESSPAPSEGSSVEDAIPPEMYVPNQQMWLQLRLKKTSFSTCCNF